jgi:hypothetical protein
MEPQRAGDGELGRRLTADERFEFDVLGYAVLEGALPPAALAAVNAALDPLHAQATRFAEARPPPTPKPACAWIGPAAAPGVLSPRLIAAGDPRPQANPEVDSSPNPALRLGGFGGGIKGTEAGLDGSWPGLDRLGLHVDRENDGLKLWVFSAPSSFQILAAPSWSGSRYRFPRFPPYIRKSR